MTVGQIWAVIPFLINEETEAQRICAGSHKAEMGYEPGKFDSIVTALNPPNIMKTPS